MRQVAVEVDSPYLFFVVAETKLGKWDAHFSGPPKRINLGTCYPDRIERIVAAAEVHFVFGLKIVGPHARGGNGEPVRGPAVKIGIQ